MVAPNNSILFLTFWLSWWSYFTLVFFFWNSPSVASKQKNNCLKHYKWNNLFSLIILLLKESYFKKLNFGKYVIGINNLTNLEINWTTFVADIFYKAKVDSSYSYSILYKEHFSLIIFNNIEKASERKKPKSVVLMLKQ